VIILKEVQKMKDTTDASFSTNLAASTLPVNFSRHRQKYLAHATVTLVRIGRLNALGFQRKTNHAGGMKGGVMNGQPVWLNVAMIPCRLKTGHQKVLYEVVAASRRVACETGLSSQLENSATLPWTTSKNMFCSFRVIGPGLPLPTGLRSTERIGVISTAVPAKKTS
jgi:hypothetical protein